MTRTVAAHHADWLSLVEVSGPFLTLPVLRRALPQGLEPTPPELARQVRTAYDEWQADRSLHGRWVRWVLAEVLAFPADTLAEGPAIPPTLSHRVAEHGVALRPDLVVSDPPGGQPRPRLLVRILPPGTQLDQRLAGDRWAATPVDRMAELLRATGVRLGLVTNGDAWTLVDAPRGAPTALATWEAAVWLEERVTLDAFRTLLGAHRFFAVADAETLEALLAESAGAEEEVTDQLGRQVRRAVELLVDAFSRADRDHGGVLLHGLTPDQVYLAAVTVMMRLVFLLSAEERGLFLLGDPLYDRSYAVSTLRAELQEQADRHGEEPLERRSTAWHRLLATFRMVHGGVGHEDLRLPAYGGSLFDPDRFAFLEGCAPGQGSASDRGRPLPVDDRTVLRILDALQVLRFAAGRGVTEARRLSFRALDVEQIGHVYEGLLDHTAVRADRPVLGLAGAYEPEVAAEEVAAYDAGGRDRFVGWLHDQTGLTRRQAEKALDADADAQTRALLLAACDNDPRLAAEVEPYHGLLRRDLRDLPQVYLPGAVYVTKGSERRATGTYYTPRSLAEEMVRHTLEPLVYHPGPADGAEPERWRLRSAAELLDLRVCDMAMGSGAFLVAACRYLADRLLEAWEQARQQAGGPITVFGQPAADAADGETVPAGADDRLLLARRLVADRCLFGVDRNPMAVEMAKLSLWLVTLAKDRPFSFLDHALRCGDSLLGVTDLAQLEHLHPDPARGRALHGGTLFDYQSTWAPVVKDAIEKRRQLESFTVVTVRDAEEKARLHREADEALAALRVIGDVVVGAAVATAAQGQDLLDGRLLDAAHVARALDPDTPDAERRIFLDDLANRGAYWLDTDRPSGAPERRCLHWPLEFPEIFLDRPRPGFDAVVGNPPFLGGKRISGPLGSAYREFLVQHVAGGSKGNADVVAYFFLRAAQVLREGGDVGLLATNTIGQGDTREVGLDRLTAAGWSIYRAIRTRPWPGGANLEIAQVWLRKGPWSGKRVLDGAAVSGVTSSLEPRSRVTGPAHRLAANGGQSFQGSNVLGMGFVLTPEEAADLIERDPRNDDVLFSYMNGHDLNTSPTQSASRWIINFGEMAERDARQYPDCWRIVEERVKPERRTKDANKYPRMVHEWWKFWNTRPGLYEAIADLDRVLLIAQVSRTLAPVLVPTGPVFSHKIVVFPYDDEGHFGLLTSALHWWWTVRYTATMRTDASYSPTDCFETFPQPDLSDEVGAAGKALDEHRRALMLERWEGLTATYNRVHDPAERASDIAELRHLHVALDHALAAAYGWSDLDLDHGFYDTRQGVRYTVGEPARTELLDRLLELNHARHADELRRGLHHKRPTRRPKTSHGQPPLQGL